MCAIGSIVEPRGGRLSIIYLRIDLRLSDYIHFLSIRTSFSKVIFPVGHLLYHLLTWCFVECTPFISLHLEIHPSPSWTSIPFFSSILECSVLSSISWIIMPVGCLISLWRGFSSTLTHIPISFSLSFSCSKSIAWFVDMGCPFYLPYSPISIFINVRVIHIVHTIGWTTWWLAFMTIRIPYGWPCSSGFLQPFIFPS